MPLLRHKMVRVFVLLIAPWLWSLAAAQQAPFVPTPQDLRPQPRLPDTPAGVVPQPPAAAPRELSKTDDDVRIDVQSYAVDDSAPAELRAALPALTARFTGKERSFEDLSNAADEVTRFLQRELGYYIGYAYLPAQDPKDGVVRIGIIEGRLDRVILNWPEGLPVDRAVVEAYLARLKPGEVLRVAEVERVVLLVNDLRGISARFEVRAGEHPGTASLVVTPRAETRWTGNVSADANGSRPLGRYELSGQVQRASPFGRGDQLTANAQASTTGGLVFGALNYAAPVGGDGLRLGASVSGLRYQLDKQDFPADLRGDALTVGAYGLYPVQRSRNRNLFALLSLDHKDYTDRTGPDLSVHKQVDSLTLGASGDLRDSLWSGGFNTFGGSLAAGHVSYADGRPDGLTDASSYTKLTASFNRLQDLGGGSALAFVALRGQYAFDNLDTTEQFRLGGPDGIRAYAPGEGTGDNGVLFNLELRWLPPAAWFDRNARDMVFSVFYDAGWIQYRTDRPATADGARSASLSGVGVGWNWTRASDFALRLSLAYPVSGTPVADPEVQRPRLYLQLSKLFN